MVGSILSQRLNVIKPSATLAVNAKASQLKAAGKAIINLGAGEPDFDTPDYIKDAAIQAIKAGDTKYTVVDGTPALKDAIAQKFKRENNLTYTPAQISVANGGKQILYNALMVTLNPGDEVIIPAPYWTSYPDMVLLAGGTPIVVNCPEKERFKLTPQNLEHAITAHTKWLILNSPGNPTGVAYTREELKALGEVLLRHPHVYVMTDDIYEHMVYDGFIFYTMAEVVPELYNRVLTVNGASKAYSMTGWRIGYAGGPQGIIKAMSILQSQSTSNPCSIAQAAAKAALEGDQSFLNEWCATYQDRRNKTTAWLNAVPGITCDLPEGAFYVFPSCRELIGKTTPQGTSLTSDSDVATYFLETVGVAVVPGAAFGAEGFFRISYATSLNNLEQACALIKKAVGELH